MITKKQAQAIISQIEAIGYLKSYRTQFDHPEVNRRFKYEIKNAQRGLVKLQTGKWPKTIRNKKRFISIWAEGPQLSDFYNEMCRIDLPIDHKKFLKDER